LIRVNGLFCLSVGYCSVLINEVNAQTGYEDSAFIELYNPEFGIVSLSNYKIVFVHGNGVHDTIRIPVGETLLPRSYYVLCQDSVSVPQCDFPIGRSFNWIQNGVGAIAITDVYGTIVDSVSYGSNFGGYTEGNFLEDNDYSLSVAWARIPNGHDTDDNREDFQLVCATPGYYNKNISDCSSQEVSQTWVPRTSITQNSVDPTFSPPTFSPYPTVFTPTFSSTSSSHVVVVWLPIVICILLLNICFLNVLVIVLLCRRNKKEVEHPYTPMMMVGGHINKGKM